MIRTVSVLFLLSMMTANESTAQNRQQLTPELLWKIGRVGLDCVSPDGQFAVYGVQRYDVPRNKSSRTLYIVDVRTGETRALTSPEEVAADAEFRPDGKRIPAVEILLNSRQVAELIERGEISGIREAMEQSLASGSRTFEQDLFRLYRDKIITLEEALANADSPTNLSWLINNAQFSDKNADKTPLPSTSIDSEPHQEEGGASFKEFTLELDED